MKGAKWTSVGQQVIPLTLFPMNERRLLKRASEPLCRQRQTKSTSRTTTLKSQYRYSLRLKKSSLNVALCACIDLSSAPPLHAIAAVLRKHQSYELSPRTNGTNPCVTAAMVGYFLPRRSKTKHHDNCAGCSIRNSAR